MLIISDRFDSIRYKSNLFEWNRFEEQEDTVDSLSLGSRHSTISIKFNQPITIRKDFPETWIWENINELGFVIQFYDFVISML